jgi:hypothetical protein
MYKTGELVREIFILFADVIYCLPLFLPERVTLIPIKVVCPRFYSPLTGGFLFFQVSDFRRIGFLLQPRFKQGRGFFHPFPR